MKFRLIRSALTAMTLLAVITPACAKAATTNSAALAVTAIVATSCTITASTVDFGTYDGANANATTNLNANGTVSATCTQGSAPTIGLGAGQNALATQRRMKDTNTDFLSYNLLQPPGTAPSAACNYATGTAWGDGTSATTGTVFTPTVALSSAARTYNVCGVIPAGQNVPVNGAGNVSYNDSVTATITF